MTDSDDAARIEVRVPDDAHIDHFRLGDELRIVIAGHLSLLMSPEKAWHLGAVATTAADEGSTR